MNDIMNLSPEGMLNRIVKNNLFVGPDYTIVIFGRRGPTGKSWLRQKLRSSGYNAVEITPSVWTLVDMVDDKNHMIIDDLEKTVTVILNKILPKYKEQWGE